MSNHQVRKCQGVRLSGMEIVLLLRAITKKSKEVKKKENKLTGNKGNVNYCRLSDFYMFNLRSIL
jgi:hypothetical protein